MLTTIAVKADPRGCDNRPCDLVDEELRPRLADLIVFSPRNIPPPPRYDSPILWGLCVLQLFARRENRSTGRPPLALAQRVLGPISAIYSRKRTGVLYPSTFVFRDLGRGDLEDSAATLQFESSKNISTGFRRDHCWTYRPNIAQPTPFILVGHIFFSALWTPWPGPGTLPFPCMYLYSTYNPAFQVVPSAGLSLPGSGPLANLWPERSP